MTGFRTDSARIPFASIEVRHGTSLHGICSWSNQVQIVKVVARGAASFGFGATA